MSNRLERINELSNKVFDFLSENKQEFSDLQLYGGFRNIVLSAQYTFPHLSDKLGHMANGTEDKPKPKVKSITPHKPITPSPSKGNIQIGEDCQGCPPSHAITSGDNAKGSIIPESLRSAIPVETTVGANKAQEPFIMEEKEIDNNKLYTTEDVYNVCLSRANSQSMDIRVMLVTLHEMVLGKKPHHKAKDITIAEKIAEFNVDQSLKK